VVTLALNKYLVSWKSGLKVTFLPLGRFCPLQTILKSDLFGCDSPLQIVMAPFLKVRQTAIIVSRGLSHPTQEVQKKKMHHTALSIYRGLSHPTGWAALLSEGGETL
jgi:hypothetical protein